MSGYEPHSSHLWTFFLSMLRSVGACRVLLIHLEHVLTCCTACHIVSVVRTALSVVLLNTSCSHFHQRLSTVEDIETIRVRSLSAFFACCPRCSCLHLVSWNSVLLAEVVFTPWQGGSVTWRIGVVFDRVVTMRLRLPTLAVRASTHICWKRCSE